MFGAAATFQIARQNSGGTATTNMTSFHPVPFFGESIQTEIAEIGFDSMRGRFDEWETRQGMISVAGDVSFRPQPEVLPAFFYGLTGTISSTAVGSATRHIFMPTQDEFGPDLDLVPWTVELFKDNQLAYQYMDGQINRLALECRGGQLLQATANIMARTSSGKAETTPTYRTGTEWAWNQASVSLGGQAYPNLETVTFTFDNALEFVPLLNGTQFASRIKRGGFRTLRIAGTLDLPVTSGFGLWDDFRTGTQRQLIVTWTQGTAISSGWFHTVQIDIPIFRFSRWQAAAGNPGRITAAFDGRAVFSTGSNTLFQLSVVNSWVSY